MHRFGPFEVDFSTSELRRSGSRVRIQEQQLRLLGVLLERPGDLIARERLRERLWPSDTFVDFGPVWPLRSLVLTKASRPLIAPFARPRSLRLPIASVT